MTLYQILHAYAGVDDEAAMTAFLAPIAAADRVRDALALKRGHGWAMSSYDAETRVAQVIICDGATIACYTVTDVTSEQAAQISVVFARNAPHLTAEAFKSAAEAVLGAPATSVQ